MEGAVVHVDRFGNLITSLRLEDLPGGQSVVEVAGRYTIDGLREPTPRAQASPPCWGAQDTWRLPCPAAPLASATGLGVGAVVRVKPILLKRQ